MTHSLHLRVWELIGDSNNPTDKMIDAREGAIETEGTRLSYRTDEWLAWVESTSMRYGHVVFPWDLTFIGWGSGDNDKTSNRIFHCLLKGNFWGARLDGLGPAKPWAMANLVAGIDGGIDLEDEAGKPSRAAMIWARSWSSLCLALSNCSLAREITLSMSPKSASLISSFLNCRKMISSFKFTAKFTINVSYNAMPISSGIPVSQWPVRQDDEFGLPPG